MSARTYPCLLRMDGVVDKRGSRSLVIFVAKDRQRFELFCACAQKRDSDGRCRHLNRYWPLIKPWYQSRTTIVPAEFARHYEPRFTNRVLTEHPKRQEPKRWVW